MRLQNKKVGIPAWRELTTSTRLVNVTERETLTTPFPVAMGGTVFS